MLFELNSPRVFVGLGLGLLVGVIVHGLAQVTVGRSLGDPASRLGRLSLDPRRHLDPFGVVAMLIAGLGWGRPVPLTEPRRPRARARFLVSVLAGPLAHLALGAALVAAASFLPAGGGGAPVIVEVAGVVNVELAVLQLIPLPPLDGARVMWVVAPASTGWQRARYYLEEQNYGLGLLLALLLPIFSGRGMLARLVDAMSLPLVDAIRAAVGLR